MEEEEGSGEVREGMLAHRCNGQGRMGRTYRAETSRKEKMMRGTKKIKS